TVGDVRTGVARAEAPLLLQAGIEEVEHEVALPRSSKQPDTRQRGEGERLLAVLRSTAVAGVFGRAFRGAAVTRECQDARIASAVLRAFGRAHERAPVGAQ